MNLLRLNFYTNYLLAPISPGGGPGYNIALPYDTVGIRLDVL